MATKKTANDKPAGGDAGGDAIALLKADHKAVKGLFEQYRKLCDNDGSDEEKGEVATKICMELTVHAQVEEEIFYPAIREAGVDDDLLDEAEVEHAGAKDLIAQISAMSPGDPLYDAKVTVLGEYIDHHVKEEEGEMFPKARDAADMEELGEEMAARKEELKGLYGAEGAGIEGSEEEPDDSATAAVPAKGKPAGGRSGSRAQR